MDRVALGFVLAALYNSGIIVLSKGFGEDLAAIDPFFSPAGCVIILLWGAAYLALSKCYAAAPGIALVFCVEKAFFALRWIGWMVDQAGLLPALVVSDPLTGLFFAVYGIGDACFMVFFGWVAWRWRGKIWPAAA